MIETIDLTNPNRPSSKKAPLANLDYHWDWTNYLTPLTDTIASYEVVGSKGIAVTGQTKDGNVVTAFVSGGTVGARSTVTCKVVTVGGRTDFRTIYLDIVER